MPEVCTTERRENRAGCWFDNSCPKFAEGNKVIAIVIGKGVKAAKELYNKVKTITPNIKKIYTDGNSCYDVAFKELGIDNLLEISVAKSKTHMIEAINSSLRDNISRMNRKTSPKCRKIKRSSLFLFKDLRAGVAFPANVMSGWKQALPKEKAKYIQKERIYYMEQ